MAKGLLQQLYEAGKINNSLKLLVGQGETIDYVISSIVTLADKIPALVVFYNSSTDVYIRDIINKWKFQDAMMGEQFITFTITSEKPIDWQVGDYCIFRGVTFTLNYVPTVTQKARTNESQDAYTYENVKFDSQQEELDRCLMLDITATTGEYVPALGTNYTGSSRFQLYCGETTAIVGGVVKTFTPVCALAAKMQANLDRMYNDGEGHGLWQILVDTTTTYVNPSGKTELVTHTEDKVLSFDNTSVAKALTEVHNTFDLDFCVKGRTIYIGYSLKNLTSDLANETFAFGYGKGYPTPEDSGKALFQIKRIANSQQKIVTRLRAVGSTKNLPYRYYNNKYDLSQALFPTNLQLPDTFEIPSVKETHNAERDVIYGINPQTGLPYIRHVKGETNDAYIDKNDDADSCSEGIREESARWDGSNSELPEIYPTIEEATYGELRAANVEDQDGNTGSGAFPNYGNDERIDELLAIGYLDNGTLVDDANQGGGILPESGTTGNGIPRSAVIAQTSLAYNSVNYGDFAYNGSYYVGTEQTLFTIQEVSPGRYIMTPTGPSYNSVIYGFNISSQTEGISADVGFRIIIKQKSKRTGDISTLATYLSDFTSTSRGQLKELALPEIPDVKEDNPKVSKIEATELSEIIVVFAPTMRNVVVPSGYTDNFAFVYQVGKSRIDTTNPYEPEYTWKSLDDDGSLEDIFHVFIKDMGFDITACWTNDTPVVAMKSGRCVGREFEIGENVEKVTYNGKKGYMLTLHRATDNDLNTYYPSAVDPIAAGDYFVLLNINMPDAFVKMAEVRLLRAATDYLADNSETQFTYQPNIDDIYLRRNYDNMLAAGTPNKSIFWRLYAGLKFTFRGIPQSEDDPLPLVELTIEQVVIQMGEGLTPKVEMTLNDDIQQSTIQKLVTSVDRIYNGSLFANGGSGTGASTAALMSILQTEGSKLFLSKKNNDKAAGVITFLRGILLGTDCGITDEGIATLKSVISENFSPDQLLGAGWGVWLDENGISTMEVDNLNVRLKAFFSELEIRKISQSGGNLMFSSAGSKIQKVTPVDVDGEETTIANAVAFRCDLFSDDGTTATMNDWHVGDQARCQMFNIKEGVYQNVSNRSYWRKVIATEERYDDNGRLTNSVILAKNGSDFYKGQYYTNGVSPSAYDYPQDGDTIVQLGSQSEPTRQNAIELVTNGDNAPALLMYQGINDYTLEEKLIKGEYYDPITHTFKSVTYGDWFVGDKTDVGGHAEYDKDTRTFNVKGKLQVGSTLDDGRDVNALGTQRGNLIQNSGFTGDYESLAIDAGKVITSDMPIFSDELIGWDATNVTVADDDTSASGKYAHIGVLSQDIALGMTENVWYVLSATIKGDATLICGSNSRIINTTEWQRIDWPFQHLGEPKVTFSGNADIREIMLVAGNLPCAWQPAATDNDKSMAEFFGMDYLRKAITDASTTTLGGLILSQIIKVGNYRNGEMTEETGGMSGARNDNQSPFLWGGGTMSKAIYTIAKYAANPTYQPTQAEIANMAQFVVTHGGRAILNDVVLRGYIYALGGLFKGNLDVGSNGDHFILDGNTNVFKVTGPDHVEDEPGFPPSSNAQQIDLFKLFTEVDSDTMSRSARMLLQSKSGYIIDFDADLTYGGITLENENDNTIPRIRLRDNYLEITCYNDFDQTWESVKFGLYETALPSVVYAGDLPTSSTGLAVGQIWNDNGTLKIKQ